MWIKIIIFHKKRNSQINSQFFPHPTGCLKNNSHHVDNAYGNGI